MLSIRGEGKVSEHMCPGTFRHVQLKFCATCTNVCLPAWKCAQDRARTHGILTVLRVIAPRFLAQLTPFLALIALILAE